MSSKSNRGDGLSIVVPTLNRSEMLRSSVKDLLAQDYSPLEVIVVDQSAAADNQLIELSREHANLRYVHATSFKGLPRARNVGWQLARYPRVLFTDDDIQCGPALAVAHVRALEQPGVGIVAGRVTEPALPPANGPVGVFSRWSGVPSGGFDSAGQFEVEHAKGCNFAVWRDVLSEVGGLDEGLTVGAALYEELELCRRVRGAGYRIWYSDAAALTHLVAPSGGCRVDQIDRYVRGLVHNRVVVIRRHLPVSHQAAAIARLSLTVSSFAVRYRRPSLLGTFLAAAAKGSEVACNPPTCSKPSSSDWSP